MAAPLDVAPTLLELAGLPPDAVAGTGDGESLLSPRVRPVISEYHGEGVQAPSAMIRSGDEKMIVSLEDPDLLFDLAADPHELQSLHADAPASASVTSSRRRCTAAGLRRGTTSPSSTPAFSMCATATTCTRCSAVLASTGATPINCRRGR